MPTPPTDVVSGAVATSAWANAVSDALQAMIGDLYAGAVVAIPWANVTGKPLTFAPTVHAHTDAASGGTIAYGDVTGKPSTFAPSAHKASHYTGGTDALTPANITAWAKAASSGTLGVTIFVGTSTPVGAVEGDVWIKG